MCRASGGERGEAWQGSHWDLPILLTHAAHSEQPHCRDSRGILVPWGTNCFLVEERLKDFFLTVLTPFPDCISQLTQFSSNVTGVFSRFTGASVSQTVFYFLHLYRKKYSLQLGILAGILAGFLSSCLCVDGKTESRELYIHSVHVCEDRCFYPPLSPSSFVCLLFFRQDLLSLTLRCTPSFPHPQHVHVTSHLSVSFV